MKKKTSAPKAPAKKKKKISKTTKKKAAKVAAAVGIVGIGAALYRNRDKVKTAVTKLISRFKKTG